jgi:uncharacterized damage-inducible protein DinB
MKETPQQYIQRIHAYIEGKNVMEVLASTPKQVAGLIESAPKDRLSKRPAPGKWSVIEILAHLADVEIVQGFRIRLILGSSGTAIQGFDQDAWARYSFYPSHDVALSLDGYRVNRERTVRLLQSLPNEMWENFGLHSERGKETVRRVSEMMAGHDLNHLGQIQALLKG